MQNILQFLDKSREAIIGCLFYVSCRAGSMKLTKDPIDIAIHCRESEAEVDPSHHLPPATTRKGRAYLSLERN